MGGSTKELYGSMQLNNFSYRPIAVFLFQRLSGTDICLFAMYVHEYGTPGEKSPNRRKAYVSYLDSTNYMQLLSFALQHTTKLCLVMLKTQK